MIERAQAFIKKHAIVLGIGVGGLIFLLILLQRRMSSSGGRGKASLDTIHSDLGQIDQDVNAIATNMSSGSFTSVYSALMNSQSNFPGPSPKPGGPPKLTDNQYITKTGDTLGHIVNLEYGVTDKAQIDPLIREVVSANQSLKSWNWAKPLPVGTRLDIPDISAFPSGSGPMELPEIWFNDEYHQLEPGFAGVGDTLDYATT